MDPFRLDLAVRDYECDIQGRVNNSVYMNYLEHTRHEYIKTLDMDFSRLHQEGIDPVVVRGELDYKLPLVNGDRFYVTISVEKKGNMRLILVQDIFRTATEEHILHGKIYVAVLKNHRPVPTKLLFPHQELQC